MSQKLVSAGPGEVLVSGLFNAVSKAAVPLWADGHNITFRDAQIEKVRGWQELVAADADILGLAQAFVSGEKRAYYATADEVHKWVNSIDVKIGDIGPGAVDPQMAVWGAFLAVTDGITALKYWPNTGTVLVPISTPFDWCKLLHRKDVHMVAANTSEGGNNISWSSASDLTDWNATASNSARTIPIRDLDSDIIAITEIGPNLAFYSRDALVIGRYIGRPFVFAMTKALNGAGALSANSVVSVNAFNYGLGQDGVFQTDGVQHRYIDDPSLRDWIQNTMDSTRTQEINGYNHEFLGLIIWHFEDAAGQKYGIGYNPTRGVCTRIDYDLAASIERDVFEYPLGAIGDKLVRLNTGYNAGTAPLPCFLRTKPLDAGSAGLFKLFDLIRTHIAAGTNGYMKVGICDTPESAVTWIYTGPLVHEHYFYREAPYIVLEFGTEAAGAQLTIAAFEIWGEPGGSI